MGDFAALLAEPDDSFPVSPVVWPDPTVERLAPWLDRSTSAAELIAPPAPPSLAAAVAGSQVTGVQFFVDGEWRDIGIRVDPIQFSKVDESDRMWDAGMAAFRAEQHFSFQVQDVNRDALRAYYGDFDAQPRSTLTVRYERSTRPEPPKRLPSSTARRYRAARRKWARDVRAWKRAGRPTEPTQIHLPNITVDVNPA